jgi:hypothetical protein
MGKASGFERAGAVLSIVVLASSLFSACGEVTASGAEQQQSCAKKPCVGKGCPPRAPTEKSDGGAACDPSSDATAATGQGGTGGGGTTGTGGAPAATEAAEFPCTVCRKAENCCKAEGFAECGYTAACANATNAEEMQFYLALCRTVLKTSTPGSGSPPDSCHL